MKPASKTAVFKVRATPKELAAYTAQAEALGMCRSTWLRYIANQAAAKFLKGAR